MIPGEVIPGDGSIVINQGRQVVTVEVLNAGDRPVQVGSHYHFAEANPALRFDRGAAWGHRLAVAAGTSVRFEPGVDRRVQLVPLAGRRVVRGLCRAVAGSLDENDAVGKMLEGIGPDGGPGLGGEVPSAEPPPEESPGG